MAQCGQGIVDAEYAYQTSFGNLKAGTKYTDVARGIDLRNNDQLLGSEYGAKVKAMAAAGMTAGTAGYSIIPVYLDPLIVDTSRKFTPLTEIIPRVTNMGVTADYVTLSKGSGFTASEDAALPDQSDTYTRVSKSIKYLYAIGRITGPALAAVPAFIKASLTAGILEEA